MSYSIETLKSARKAESGFTLVELAVVMIIIGLLIGGVLQGQELINNARISSVASAAEAVDTGGTSFIDVYGDLPGDIQSPTTRLPNCTANTCALAGNGDGVLTGGNEETAMFAHLGAADYLSGIANPNVAAAIGLTHLELAIPQATFAAHAHAATGALGQHALARRGAYLHTGNVIAGGGDALTALQAAAIDQKVDDGNPALGNVFGEGCAVTATEYNSRDIDPDCDLYMGLSF